VNIEEEFKKKTGNYQQSSMNAIKVSEQDIIEALRSCNIQLSQDENVTLQAFIVHNKDGSHATRGSMVNLIQFLTAIGLPPQTLGLAQSIPKKVLNQNELRLAQNIMINIRKELAGRN